MGHYLRELWESGRREGYWKSYGNLVVEKGIARVVGVRSSRSGSHSVWSGSLVGRVTGVRQGLCGEYYFVSAHVDGTALGWVDALVHGSSQPQRIITGLRETFVNRCIVERAGKAELSQEEQSENVESYRENVWNEIQLKGPKRHK